MLRLFRLALGCSLAISTLLFILWTWHWPLVGDASLIHYICFLIEHGMAPYRDLGDMNMPGSFLIELAAMHLFGSGALAWRLFDLTLLAFATAAFLVITQTSCSDGQEARPRADTWLAGVFAAGLFILIHGRDGLAQGGQRDLTMAVCLLAATACIFLAVRRHSLWATAAFGLFAGIALTIKPTALPLTLTQLLLASYAQRKRGLPWFSYVAFATGSFLLAPFIALVFLLKEHALTAFLQGLHGIVPYYASLGHRPFSFLLLHSISPLLPLVLFWFAILVLLRPALHWERAALLCGVLLGLISYIVQARGFPYYRYTLLAFLLPLMALDFTQALALRPASTLRVKALRTLALFALAIGGFFIAPQSAIILHGFRWQQTDFITSLEDNLNRLGGASLSGHIQCIDSISGCGTTLYKMRLVQSTGVLSDFLLFGPANVPVIQHTRAQFSNAILSHPPQVIVVSSALHIDGPDHYQKLDRWPAFASFLASTYTLDTEWSPTRPAKWWSREQWPAGYRIYILRTSHP